MVFQPEQPFYHTIAAVVAARQSIVAATIVRHSGSVPRRTGTKMLVLADGTFHGTIGGGIFELLVIRAALEALAEGRSVTHSYSFNPKGVDVDAFGAVCGGRAEVFFEVIMPPDQLLIVGGGHCGKALAAAASVLDFSMIIADDRREFANKGDFLYSNVAAVLQVAGDFSDLPEPDERTYVALVSKGFLSDEAALRRVIHSRAPYIGMIGSINKRNAVYDKLRGDGISEELLGRVHSPIGLEINADTPEEIAVSILAQIIQVRARLKSNK